MSRASVALKAITGHAPFARASFDFEALEVLVDGGLASSAHFRVAEVRGRFEEGTSRTEVSTGRVKAQLKFLRAYRCCWPRRDAQRHLNSAKSVPRSVLQVRWVS